MHLTFLTLTTVLALTALIPLIASLLTTRSNSDREKLSPFECGFDPKNSARIPFSLRFFLLAVIFLVFDIETILLLPTPLLVPCPLPPSSSIALLLFILILTMGLIHEWNEGSLDWTN